MWGGGRGCLTVCHPPRHPVGLDPGVSSRSRRFPAGADMIPMHRSQRSRRRTSNRGHGDDYTRQRSGRGGGKGEEKTPGGSVGSRQLRKILQGGDTRRVSQGADVVGNATPGGRKRRRLPRAGAPREGTRQDDVGCERREEHRAHPRGQATERRARGTTNVNDADTGDVLGETSSYVHQGLGHWIGTTSNAGSQSGARGQPWMIKRSNREPTRQTTSRG